MRKLLILLVLSVFWLAACGSVDDEESDNGDKNPTSAVENVSNASSDSADTAEGGQFTLHVTGQVDHLGENDVLLETIMFDSSIPVNGRLIYEGQTRNDEPRYTLHLAAFNVEHPNRTQVDLVTDGEDTGVIFSELALSLHQPVSGTTFTFADDLTGDSYGEMVELEYELWTVSEWQASFDHFEPETLTGTVTIAQLDTAASGSLSLTVPVLSDSTPRVPIGEIQLSVEFAGVALENPDDRP